MCACLCVCSKTQQVIPPSVLYSFLSSVSILCCFLLFQVMADVNYPNSYCPSIIIVIILYWLCYELLASSLRSDSRCKKLQNVINNILLLLL